MRTENRHITAIIDGEPVKAARGSTILEAARKSGIYIPTLCHLEGLPSYGGCRLCIVEIKGKKGFLTACTTPLEPAMEVKTKSKSLQSLRRNILELTLSEHPYTCLVCGDKKECGEFMHSTRKAGTITGCNFCTSNGDCELQELIDYLELGQMNYPIAYRGIKPEKNNPFYDLDYNLCVLCGRCVRICNEERNSNVLAFVKRGNASIVGTAFADSQADAGCEFCGACVDVCPTGSISEKMGKWAGMPDRSTRTTCTLCSLGCTMNVNTRGNRVVNVGPRPGERMDPPQLCIRAKFLIGDITHHPDRISSPLIRKKDKWIETGWDEALEYTAEKLGKHRGNKFGILGSGQDTLEENYSLWKFSSQVMESKNFDLIDNGFDRQSILKLHSLLNGSARLEQLEKSDAILLLGTDASLSHPLLENRIRKASRQGTQILYANQRSSRTSIFSTRAVYFKPGRENLFLYLLTACLSRCIIPELPAGFAGKSSDQLLDKSLKSCSIQRDELDAFASSLAHAERLCIIVDGSFLHPANIEETHKALGNIQYLKQGRKACNVIIPGLQSHDHSGMLNGVSGDVPSRDEMLRSIGREGVTALMIAGNLPGGAYLKKVKFLVQLNMFKTPMSEFADVFLPVSGLLENRGHFRALDGKIKTIRKAMNPPENARTVQRIFADLAGLMGHVGYPSSPTAIWKEIRANGGKKAGKPPKAMLAYQPLDPSVHPVRVGRFKQFQDGSPAFQYRGNDLTGLVPDLDFVLESMQKNYP